LATTTWVLTETPKGKLRWRGWEIDRLYWTHTSALLLLQGGDFPLVFRGRFVLVSASALPVHSPTPGLKDVLLAEVKEAPPNFSAQDVFLAVAEDAMSGRPVFRT
jgi:hypothetical protein